MIVVVEKLRDTCVEHVGGLLSSLISRVESGEINDVGGVVMLTKNREAIQDAFAKGIYNKFEELLDRDIEKPEPVYDFETLSLVQDDDLEVMVALEGMVNAARNKQLGTFISFNTRLNSLFDNMRVDESSNPMDPSQIADAFKDAVQPLSLDPKDTMSLYRRFNSEILLKLEDILKECNTLLVESGVLPDLKMDGTMGGQSGGGRSASRSASRSQPRDDAHGFGTVEETPHNQPQNNPEMFSMMQNLLAQQAAGGVPGGGMPAGGAPAGGVPAGGMPAGGDPNAQQFAIPASMAGQAGVMQPFQPAAGQQVQMVDQNQLMQILTNIQQALETRPANEGGDALPLDQTDISSHLGEMLAEGSADGVVNAVDRQSSDIINLVSMLYDAIWRDESVPIPIKELIGRTQVTIIKVALSDQDFFNNEGHPARMVLNDFAEAGIGWTEVENLDEDPLYKKIQELVSKILMEYTDQEGFFEAIVKDFRSFRAKEVAKTRVLEQRIMRAKERKERLDDIHELVTQKIEERVLGRELPSFVEELLEGPFHKFMSMLVLKEGPGTNAWKQAINTIDVLLWTVQPHKHASDRERLGTVNPRLLNNLRKAFRIAQLDPQEVDQTIEGLKGVQESSFQAEESAEATGTDDGELDLGLAQETADKGEEDAGIPIDMPEEELSEDDPIVQQVDTLSVGVWVEFVGDDEESAVRCKLAAKINAIDKYIFVNRAGVKVVEKTRMGLAQELKDGTVKFISDGPLFSRALESVIGNLRESQQEQQQGGAYRPEENTA